MEEEIKVLEKLIELSTYTDDNNVYPLIEEYCILEKVGLDPKYILEKMEAHYKK